MPFFRVLRLVRRGGPLLCSLLLNATAHADEPAASPDSRAACTTQFTAQDPRLFDFVKTRRAVDFNALNGRRIRSISIITLPIFNEADPHENNLLFRAANRLHLLTRDDTIRRQLLLHSGEALDVDHLRESERLLRGEGYLYDAMILPGEVCAEQLDLLVVVRDIWTLQPALSFGRSGGQNSSSIGLVDENLLGYGHNLSISLNKNAQRSGVVFGFSSSHLFDGHTLSDVSYARNDDGRSSSFTLDHPFYAFDVRKAAGITAFSDTRRESETAGGVTFNRYQHQHEGVEGYVGLAQPVRERSVRRWRLGFTYEDERYGEQDPAYSAALPDNRQTAYPWLELERREDVYVTTSNLQQLFRNEDVNLGEEWKVRFGASTPLLRSDNRTLYLSATYNNTVGFGSHHLLRNAVSTQLQRDQDKQVWVNSLVSAASSYDYFIDDNNRWHASLAVDAGTGLSGNKLLKAGGDALLRGYPSGWQAGDRRAVLNIERRQFYDVHLLHLFRLGAAAFAEVGRAWDSHDQITQSNNVLADIGIGLRANSSKARPNHVMHLDFSLPLTDRGKVKGWQWSLQSQNSF